MALAAIVVCHNHSNHLSETIAAFAQQKTPIDHLVLVSDFGNVVIAENLVGTNLIQVASKHTDDFDKAVKDAVAALSPEFKSDERNWLWLLSNRAVPQPGSLDQLFARLESAVSAAVIAPKIMDGQNPRMIREMGVSLTSRNSVFVPVADELDQGQHDHVEDVLAASLEGALVNLARVNQAGGFATKFASFAADIELAIRLRLSGSRVVIADQARVNQFDEKRKSPRFADMQLKLMYWPLWLALLFAVTVPVLVVIKSLLLLLTKQPEFIGSELAAGIRAFFTSPSILLARRNLTSKQRRALVSLRVLFASREAVKTKKIEQRHYAQLQGVSNPADSTSATSTLTVVDAVSSAPKFFASGAGWIAVLLACLSWQYWPSAASVSGPGLLTLGSDWLDLFARTGASWQPLANGFFAPSDAFNWVLLALGSITFWAPSLSIAILVFLLKPLAFAAAWRALTLVTDKFWLLTAGGLIYAFWPSFTAAQSQGRLAALVAHLLLPLFVFALARTLGFAGVKLSRQATWAWLALTALLAAALSAAAPSLAGFVAVAVFGLAIYRYRKLGYLIWLPIPMAVIWAPTVWYLAVGLGHPMALLADPGLPLATPQLSAWRLLLGGVQPDSSSPLVLALSALGVAVVLAIGLLAPWRSRSSSAFFLWLGLAAAVAAAWAFQQVQFVANGVVGSSTGEAYVNGSPQALLSVAALLAVFLLALALHENSKLLNRAGGFLASLATATGLALYFLTPSQLVFGDARVMPAIVQAEAQQKIDGQPKQIRTLVIRPQLSTDKTLNYTATLVTGDGIQQADLSVNYRFTLAKLTQSDAKFAELANIAANLVAANDTSVLSQLLKQGISYVLVPNVTAASTEVSNALDSSSQLIRVGTTEFGSLYKVNGEPTREQQAAANQDASDDYWSITKSVQLGVLLAFFLLAIPTRRRNQTTAFEDQFDSFDPADSGDGTVDNQSSFGVGR